MRILFLIILGLLIFSCEKKESSDSIDIDSTAVVDSIMTRQGLASEILEQAPEWYKTLPINEGYMYAKGVAKSRRANIASEKAVMEAQVNLAEKLNELGISSNSESEIPLGADSDPDNDNLTVTMQDVLVKDKKQFKSGKLWYSFVLLEIKIEK